MRRLTPHDASRRQLIPRVEPDFYQVSLISDTEITEDNSSNSVTLESSYRTNIPIITSPEVARQVQKPIVTFDNNSLVDVHARQQLLQTEYSIARNLNNSLILFQQKRNAQNILQQQIIAQKAILAGLQREESDLLKSTMNNLGILGESHTTALLATGTTIGAPFPMNYPQAKKFESIDQHVRGTSSLQYAQLIPRVG